MARLLASADELTRLLEEAGDKLVILDFFATWCAPCKIMAPVLDEIAPDEEALLVLKIDINQLEDLAEEYGISAMPTFVFLRNKRILGTYVGANVTKFKETVELYKGVAWRRRNKGQRKSSFIVHLIFLKNIVLSYGSNTIIAFIMLTVT